MGSGKREVCYEKVLFFTFSILRKNYEENMFIPLT